MEVTLELIIGIAFFLVGARFVYIGKMDVEFGITNGHQALVQNSLLLKLNL
jgi:hypothetical protein